MIRSTQAFPSDNFIGMEMRDYFAGQALSGIMANSEYEKLRQSMDNEVDEKEQLIALSEYTYTIADAMLEARNK